MLQYPPIARSRQSRPLGGTAPRDRSVPRSGSGPGPGSAGDAPPGPLLENARHTEVVLCRFRYAVAALAVIMAAWRRPLSPTTAVTFFVIPVAVNACVWVALRRVGTLGAVRKLGHWVLAADAAVATVTYLLFLGDPHALPAAFVPLLVFELTLRHEGWRATAVSLAVFVGAVAVRVFFQLRVIPGGSLRWPLLLVWLLLAVLILVLSRELKAQARMRFAAQHERERIAESFRAVVGEVLTRSGVPEQAATWGDVLTSVHRLCEEQPEECATLAAEIADLLVPATREFGLTRREREIVRLLGMGYTYDRIARALFVSGSTVRNHVHNIKSKLGVSSREEVAAFAREHGLSPPTSSEGANAAAG